MLEVFALPPFSGRLNLFTAVCGMVWRKECVHYIAVLGTIVPGWFSLCSKTNPYLLGISGSTTL